jgi:Flp pilus assembly protein TadG
VTVVAATSRFLKDSQAAATVVFGLAIIPITAAVGLSIDVGGAYLARTQLQTAVDSAALAAARNFQSVKDVAKAESVARSVFATMAPKQSNGQISELSVDQTGGVTVAATGTVSTPIIALASPGTTQMGISATAVVMAQEQGLGKDLEVALMLDVTSSMSSGSGTSGLTKLQAMQSAARGLIDKTLTTGASNHQARVALAPFSAAVNVGTYFQAVTGVAPSGSWTSVVERSGASAFTDDPPRSGTYFPSYQALHTSALSPNSTIAKIERNRTYNIPTTSLVTPLTSDKTVLNNAINQLSANGTTGGHLGTAWAWYLLSPNWSSIWPTASVPAAYSRDTYKVAVLMSDFDYNVYYKSANGDMNVQAAALCANMKAAGIVIYTIGFQVDSANARAVDLFKGCASDSSKAVSAQTGSELIAAYEAIARTVLDSVASPVRLAR